jgi:hypothetical protein
MNKKHRYVPLEQIIPGTLLADELLDKLGHVLLPAGTSLTPAILKAVANHNIHHLSITIDHDQIEDEVHADGENKAHQLQRLEQLFRHAPYEKPTETLRTYIERYRRNETS